MTIPFREHRFSAEDYEFVVATRKFYPKALHVVIVAAALGPLTYMGCWQVGFDHWTSALVALSVSAGSLGLIPLIFMFRTGQLAVENYLLGNITSIMGHVNWPPVWQNVLGERAVTYDWADIERVIIRPAPWAFAPGNLNLDLTFHDGRQRTMRVPRLSRIEVEALIQVLELIAVRRGVRFQKGPALHHPLVPFADLD